MILIEKIAPYLPYNLKGRESKDSHDYELESLSKDNLLWKPLYKAGSIERRLPRRIDCKPILRPLSDLIKEENIKIWNYVLNDDSRDLSTLCEQNEDVAYQLSYCVFQSLVSNLFDVFGLISQNLAIDINKLNK